MGCDKYSYFNHIVAQFVDGMCLNRMDEIDIDHRTPLAFPGASGGKPTQDEVIARLHYLNCSPMWSKDNRVKCNRYAEDPLEHPADQQPADDAVAAIADDLDAVALDAPVAQA